MSVYALGTDIVQISRVSRLHRLHGQKFLKYAAIQLIIDAYHLFIWILMLPIAQIRQKLKCSVLIFRRAFYASD